LRKFTKSTTTPNSTISSFLAKQRICSALVSPKAENFSRHLGLISMGIKNLNPKWLKIIFLSSRIVRLSLMLTLPAFWKSEEPKIPQPFSLSIM